MSPAIPHTVTRWLKFNLVGATGMAVQLTALALLNRGIPGHYLVATAVAVEFAVLHNFVLHLHFTWRDRRNTSTIPMQFVRFQLANGIVSLLGNLVLMRLLVSQSHLPVVAANGLAILTCSIANFYLGGAWVFAADHHRRSAHEL